MGVSHCAPEQVALECKGSRGVGDNLRSGYFGQHRWPRPAQTQAVYWPERCGSPTGEVIIAESGVRPRVEGRGGCVGYGDERLLQTVEAAASRTCDQALKSLDRST